MRCGSCEKRASRLPRSLGILGVNEGTLGNWVNKDLNAGRPGDGRLSESEREELLRLRRENAELAMERDVLKRSVVLWVKEAMK